MSTLKRADRDGVLTEGRPDVSQFPSSPGDSPIVQTPKDVQPGDAAARDVTSRNVNSDDPVERQEALLDEASDLSFPASDPIAVSSISKITEKDDAMRRTDGKQEWSR